MADQAVINAMNAAIAAIQALQTAVTRIPAAIQSAVQPAPMAAGPFIRTPFRANIAAVRDYSSNKDHRKAYQTLTALLFPHDQKFDVEPNKFQTFMNLLNV